MRVLTGHVYIDDDQNGLRVKFRLAEDTVTVSTEEGDLGKWTPLATEVEDIGSDRFRLLLGEEALEFSPDDPVEFRYEVLPLLGDKGTKRSRRGARKAKTAQQALDGTTDAPAEESAAKARPKSKPRSGSTTQSTSRKPVVEPTPHEPLVATATTEATRPASKKATTQPARASRASSKPQPPPKKAPLPEEATPAAAETPKVSVGEAPYPNRQVESSRTLAPAEENGSKKPLAASLAASATEKAKQAPAAISDGVRRLFVRAPEPDDHRHYFESNGIPGGLVRHICTECGHVSVDLREENVEAIRESSLFKRRVRL